MARSSGLSEHNSHSFVKLEVALEESRGRLRQLLEIGASQKKVVEGLFPRVTSALDAEMRVCGDRVIPSRH